MFSYDQIEFLSPDVSHWYSDSSYGNSYPYAHDPSLITPSRTKIVFNFDILLYRHPILTWTLDSPFLILLLVKGSSDTDGEQKTSEKVQKSPSWKNS